MSQCRHPKKEVGLDRFKIPESETGDSEIKDVLVVEYLNETIPDFDDPDEEDAYLEAQLLGLDNDDASSNKTGADATEAEKVEEKNAEEKKTTTGGSVA